VAVKTSWWTVLACVAVAAACSRHVPAPPAAAPDEPEPLSVTRWTAKTELFAEYPTLTVGKASRFAIHLTRLDGFKAVTEGKVDVHLRGGGAPAEVFRVDGPSRPGIFGVDVTPVHAATREMVIRLQSTSLTDEHVVGAVAVHATVDAARKASAGESEEAPGISFLKEQQWSLDFGTALVQAQALRESFAVPARMVARPGGTAAVVAPVDGRLVRVADLTLGVRVSQGQELARLLPSPSVPGDLPQLQRARAEAATSHALATRDRERAERLTTAGAAPEKRLDEARTAETQARSRLDAAEASLAQYDAARGAGVTRGDGLFVVRAPIAGVIAERAATSGANVTSGTALFQIVDPTHVQVVGQVPEVDAARVRGVTGAEIEAPGREVRLSTGALVSVGQVVDPLARALPITFAFDNRTAGVPVGQAVTLHLLMAPTTPRPVIPAAAVVDDAGRPIVFVQTGGESFERRAITLGPRTGAIVQVIEGIQVGERVVTTGAYLVRLASLSTSVPAHGHVH
jgi:RND family efflux transporter MFP subunit